MYFYFQPRWYITWSSLPYWNNFNKPHKIYRTIVFETTGHQIMMDNDPRVWKQMRWVRDCPSLLPLEKVQATAQLKWRNKAELQKLPELRRAKLPRPRQLEFEWQKRKLHRKNRNLQWIPHPSKGFNAWEHNYIVRRYCLTV